MYQNYNTIIVLLIIKVLSKVSDFFGVLTLEHPTMEVQAEYCAQKSLGIFPSCVDKCHTGYVHLLPLVSNLSGYFSFD